MYFIRFGWCSGFIQGFFPSILLQWTPIGCFITLSTLSALAGGLHDISSQGCVTANCSLTGNDNRICLLNRINGNSCRLRSWRENERTLCGCGNDTSDEWANVINCSADSSVIIQLIVAASFSSTPQWGWQPLRVQSVHTHLSDCYGHTTLHPHSTLPTRLKYHCMRAQIRPVAVQQCMCSDFMHFFCTFLCFITDNLPIYWVQLLHFVLNTIYF